MAVVRSFAALFLIVLASTLTAQNAPTGQVVITVIDQTGAAIPDAHIRLVSLPSAIPSDSDWLNYAFHTSEQTLAHTDATGEATIGLANGAYAVAITAQGFRGYFERIEIREGMSRSVRATLAIGSGCTECVTVQPDHEIRVEHGVSLSIFIPLEPLQTIIVTNARARRRWLRF